MRPWATRSRARARSADGGSIATNRSSGRSSNRTSYRAERGSACRTAYWERAFAFTVGRSYPADGEEIDGESISQAVADCRLAIEILGRRVPGAVPLNALTATADFALNVLYVEGAHLHDPAKLDLAEVRVAATIDGKTVSTGCGGDVMTHPLEAVAWLARELKRRGRELESGDLIATGTCVGILQVMPGQVFAADFGPLGRVSVSLE